MFILTLLALMFSQQDLSESIEERRYREAPSLSEEFDFIVVYPKENHTIYHFYSKLQDGTVKAVASKYSYQSDNAHKAVRTSFGGGFSVEFFDSIEGVHRKCWVKPERVLVIPLGTNSYPSSVDWRFMRGFRKVPEELKIKEYFEEDE